VIIESSDGALWFGTRGGVSRYHEGRICTTFTAIDGLVYGGVSAIIESSDGAMWFGTGGGMGTGGGVSRYQDGKWDTVTTADELANNDVQAIIESSDGALWFGTGGGAGRYQEGRIWTTFIENDDLADSCVMAIVESDGALWFGTYGGGVSRFQNGNWDTFTKADGLVNNCVRAIIESSDGALWFGTAGGINRFQGGIFTPFTEADGLVDKYVYAIIESSDRALWFGTSGGVSRYQHEIWTSFTKADGLVDNNIRAIIESSNGALWFGTEHGISKLKPDKIPPFTSITNAPDLIAGTNVSDLITGTLTPMFIFRGFDYRTPEHKLLYSYAVFDGGGNPVLDWSDYSNVTYIKTPALRDGKLRFSVIAVDSWGNEDPTPATKIFTIDSTPPTVIISSPEEQDFVSGPVEIRGSAFDPFPSQDFHSYELRYANWNDFEDISKWKTDRFSGIDSSRQIRDSTLAIWETKGLTNGRYWLQLSARDTLGHESRTFVAVEVVNASEITDAINGSFLSSESGNIEIYIPPNAIPNDLTIGIKDYPIDEVIPVPDSGITFANLCFEIVPTDIILSKPGTLSLIYPDSLINNKKEYKLAFYYSPYDSIYNGYNSWERLGGTINTKEKKITTSFKPFGLFALYEDLTYGGEKEGIFNVNCQPRIFSPKGDERTAISFELGKRTNVTIKIYNAAGRLVKILKYNESFSHGNNVVYWNGKDRWSKFCVSGLYIVTIEAGDKMATKTFMVLNE
jgi:hypothetical protein